MLRKTTQKILNAFGQWYAFAQTLVDCWVFVPSQPILMILLLSVFQCYALPATRYQMDQNWLQYQEYYDRLLSWVRDDKADLDYKQIAFKLLLAFLVLWLLVYVGSAFLSAVGGLHVLLRQIVALPWLTWSISFLGLLPGFIFALVDVGCDALMWLFDPILRGAFWNQVSQLKNHCVAHPWQAAGWLVLLVLATQVAGSVSLMWVTGAQKCLMASGLWFGSVVVIPPGLLLMVRIALILDFMKRMVNMIGSYVQGASTARSPMLERVYDLVVERHAVSGLFLAAMSCVALFRGLMTIKTLVLLGGVGRFALLAPVSSIILSECEVICRGVLYYYEPVKQKSGHGVSQESPTL